MRGCRLKILIVSRGYPTKKYPMNGIFEFDQAKALVDLGHKVIYAAVDLRSIRRTRKWGFESFIKEGVQVEAVNIPCGRIPNSILAKIHIIALKKLYKSIHDRYGRPDVIHSHFLKCGYATACIFKDKGIPLVLTEHLSSMNKKNLDPDLMKLGEYTYTNFSKVISVSTLLSNNLREKFGVESVVIPNIVDTESFNINHKVLNKDAFKFITVGSLIERKGIDLLIDAFNMAFQENKKVRLYIYGDGPERKTLENMIQQYGLGDQVFIMGLKDRKEIAKQMSNSQCFVLPSKLETFGVVFIEAMAMGLPVIATSCGGPEDFVTDQNGMLIPKNNIDSLVRALKEMYHSAENFDRVLISNITKNKFSATNVASKLTNLYSEILNEESVRK